MSRTNKGGAVFPRDCAESASWRGLVQTPNFWPKRTQGPERKMGPKDLGRPFIVGQHILFRGAPEAVTEVLTGTSSP